MSETNAPKTPAAVEQPVVITDRKAEPQIEIDWFETLRWELIQEITDVLTGYTAMQDGVVVHRGVQFDLVYFLKDILSDLENTTVWGDEDVNHFLQLIEEKKRTAPIVRMPKVEGKQIFRSREAETEAA